MNNKKATPAPTPTKPATPAPQPLHKSVEFAERPLYESNTVMQTRPTPPDPGKK